MWPPKIAAMPRLFREPFEAIIARIDAGWAISGIGIRVVDALGGGRSVNRFGPRDASSVAAERISLVCSVVAADGVEHMEVSYGTINGVVPNGLHVTDIPPKILTFPSDAGYIYALGVFNDGDWQWTGANVVLSETNDIPNTATDAYRIIGIWNSSGTPASKTIEQEIFGPVSIPVCDLIFP